MRSNTTDQTPVSLTQERFWIVDQLLPGTAVHNLAFEMDITGPLDADAIEWALNRIVERHEILRTRFRLVDGHLTQRFPDHDGRAVTRLRAAAPDDVIARAAYEPFDYLADRAMLRMVLVELEPNRHRLVFAAHHAVFDGWSTGVFAGELTELYQARVTGRAPRLPELTVQYGDYARRQREAHDNGAFDDELAYWAEQLRDVSAPLELPTDFARPARPRMRGAAHRFTIPTTVADRVRALAVHESGTAFTAWMAVFQLLLYRHSGQETFTVGGPVSNRPEQRLEPLIGPFINVLVFRADMTGDPTLREVLHRVREAVRGALSHQQLPLQAVADRVGSPGSQLFRTALAFQPFAAPAPDLGDDLAVRTVPLDTAHAQNDLSLFLTPGTQGIDVLAQYDTDLFRPDTVAALCADFVAVAQRMTRDPDLPVSRIRATASAPSPVDTAYDFPLSRQQLRWWPDRELRHVTRTTLPEPPDADALRAAVRLVERRYDVLRMRIDPESPRWRIAEPGHLDLCTDIDNASGPVSVALVSGADRAELVLSSQRTALDEWSHDRVLRDILAALDGSSEVDKQPLGFADYAIWQRRQLHGDRITEHADHWRTTLAGAPPVVIPPAQVSATPARVAIDPMDQADLLAATLVLLKRHTGQNDLVINVALRDEHGPIVGCLTDILPIRATVDESEPFRDLAHRVRQSLVDAREHRNLAPTVNSPALVRLDEPMAVTIGSRLDVAAQLHHLIAQLTADPRRPVATAETLPPALRAAALTDLVTPDLTDTDGTLHGRFEHHVAGQPDAIALIDGAEMLSYAELDAWANRIAHGLIARGVQPGQPVVIQLANSPAAVAALFGVLKAGAVFVCLDPRTPADRLEMTLVDLSPAVVLDDITQFDDQPTTAAAIPVIPADPAYIAYTSGSTGRPKGIPHRHRDLVQFVQWQSAQFGIGPGQRVGQLATLAFDVAYCEIFGALCHGATLCVRPAAANDPVVLGDWLHRQRITLVQIIPRLFREVLAAQAVRGRTEQALAELRTVLFVGEVLPADLVVQTPDWIQVVNVYGPTEVVAATFALVDRSPATAATAPIGRPIPGRHLLLLDETGRPCPPGVVGEIWIASRYLAGAYHGDPDQTAAHYHASEFPEVPGILYRTGDLALLRADDRLEFAGRADNQVKLSGVRLELAEVELAVARHRHVRECAAVVRTESDTQRLIAYVTADGPVDDLGTFLKEFVPAYMVPAEVVTLPALPRTISGKVDRNALPEPPGVRTTTEGVEPRTPLERHLAELAGQVLGTTAVGITDDLFDLGGNSLQAARFVNRIREAYGVAIPLQQLFENPTVAATAAATEHARAALGHADRLARIEQDLNRLSDNEVRALLARHQADHELENHERHGTVRPTDA